VPGAQLDRAEHEEAAFEVMALQPAVDLRQRVAPEVCDGLLLEIAGELVDVAPQALQLCVLGLGDRHRDHVHDAAIFWKPGRYLDADQRVIRILAAQLERAIDRIVICDRDEIHTASLRDRIHVTDGGVALGRPAGAQEPAVRAIGVRRVNVEIDGRQAYVIASPRCACILVS
jgi:hypothetical protein